MRLYYFNILSALLIFVAVGAKAQVTIGSANPPQKGTILDLKQHDPDAKNATAEKGLLLPRVELKQLGKLLFGTSEILNGDNGGGQYKKHEGLMVYNINKTDSLCIGTYAWDGKKWNPLFSCNGSGDGDGGFGSGPISVYPDTLEIPSGQDLRVSDMSFVISWKNTKAKLNDPTHVAISPFNDVNYVAKDLSTFKAPMAIVNFDAVPMTVTDVSDQLSGSTYVGNPFKTNRANYTFSVTDNSTTPATTVSITKPVVVNQTNKALTMNRQYKPKIIPRKLDTKNTSIVINTYAPIDTSEANKLKILSNAEYKLKSINQDVSIIQSISIDSEAMIAGSTTQKKGTELQDGTAVTTYLSMTVQNPTDYTVFASADFTDANPILGKPRFNDLRVNIFLCVANKSREMEDWVTFLGIGNPMTKDTWLSNKTAGRIDDTKNNIDIPQAISGIAWHRDQDGNIFLSGSFDKDSPTSNNNRWMITNLAAQTFDPERSDGTTASTTQPSINIASSSTTAFYMMYPPARSHSSNNGAVINGSSLATILADGNIKYQQDKRLGMLYNSATATMSTSALPNPTPDGVYVQGICPNGWHLPSAKEYQALLGKDGSTQSDITLTQNSSIGSSYSTYSMLPDDAVANDMGKAVKEACFFNESDPSIGGQSNPISPKSRAGFNLLLSGYERFDGTQIVIEPYGNIGGLWSSSNTYNMVSVAAGTGSLQSSTTNNRAMKLSVRCKKNSF